MFAGTRTYINRQPVKFSYEVACSVRDFILSKIDKDLRYIDPPKIYQDIFGSELKRFMCSLEAYRRSPNPVLEMTYLLSLIPYIDAANFLKKVRNKSYRESVYSNPFEYTDEYKMLPSFKINDIGDIFNYNYWIFWEEDPEADLEENSMIDIQPISHEFREEFETVLRSIVPDSIEEVPEEEILIQTSGSTCYNSGSRYVYQAKEHNNSFSNEPLCGRRSHIRISPDNVRDAIVLPVQQSNSVKLIEKQVALIAEKIKGSAYVRNEEEFKNILDDFYDKGTFFTDRDIKKEGLTKPRELIHITLKVFKELYPECPAWAYSDIYKSFSVIDYDKQKKNMLRGHGLGMANALTTIIQIVIFNMCRNRLILSFGDVARESYCIAYNDDFTAAFTEEYLANEYWDIEDDVLSNLQVIRQPSKSYISEKAFSFCEKYYPESFNQKVSYRLNEFYSTFALPNISVAKYFVNSLSRNEFPGFIDEFIEELVSYYGYEFFYEEWKYPYAFGGWTTPTIMDVDLTYAWEIDISDEVLSAFNACRGKLITRKGSKEGRRYISPLETIYMRDDLIIPDEFIDLVNYNKSIKEISLLYSLKNNDQYLNKIFSEFYYKRRDSFLNDSHSFYNLRTTFYDYIKRDPLKDVLPPRCLIYKKNVKEVPLDDDYINPTIHTPILSMVKYFNPTKIPDNIIPVILKIDKLKYNKLNITEHQMRSCDIFTYQGKESLEYDSFLENAEIEGGNSSNYLNPLQVINVFLYVYKEIGYPDIYDPKDISDHIYRNDPEIIELLSSRTWSKFFKTHSKVSYKECIERIRLIQEFGWDEVRNILRDIRKTDEPEVDLEFSSEEEELPMRKIMTFPEWERQSRPRNIQRDMWEFFNRIRHIREDQGLGAGSDYFVGFQGFKQSHPNDIEWCLRNKVLIESQGGEVIRPRESYIYIVFPELDSDDDTSEGDPEEITLFDSD